MNISRRWFIGGASAFGALGAFGGNRFMKLPGFVPSGEPELKFGVISDIHIKAYSNAGKKIATGSLNLTFKSTLEWFRDQKVDAVVIAGDMADNSLIEELQFVADAWESVFPGGKAPDGRKVEKVFVYGNHDEAGNNFATRYYPDKTERAKYALLADYGGWWERIFGEPYSTVYSKNIKGYTFIGTHWDRGDWRPGGNRTDPFGLIGPYLAEHGEKIDPSKPFFYIQHPHLKDTCYGPWAWGHDNGDATRALMAYPNAIAISGHSHYSLTDERSVWQGAFTSVGAASLWYVASPNDALAPSGYENTYGSGSVAWREDAAKMMPRFNPWGCRQGMLWSIYHDCIVMKRREFQCGLDVGDDWVLPLPVAESKPFAFAERAKTIGVPEFAADAKLTITRIRAKNRGGKSRKGDASIVAEEKDALRIEIPRIPPINGRRVMDFEVAAEAADGTSLIKHVLHEGFHEPIGRRRAESVAECVFAVAELPKKCVRVKVTPRNCFGACGKALVAPMEV